MNNQQKMISEIPFFNALYNNSKEICVLILDTNGIVLSINPAFCNCFGYSEKDLIGKSGIILFTEEDQKNGRFEHELKEVHASGQSYDNNYLVNKNKKITWVSGESVLVKKEDGTIIILKVIQDIHEQKNNEISLRELNKFNENILESIKDSVVVIDEQMNIIKSNKAFLSTFNLQPHEISTFDFVSLISKCDSGYPILENIQSVFNSQAAFSNKHLEIKSATGNKRIFELTCSYLENSASQHVLLILHDVTVYKELEKEREDFIGFITHELRNPLSNVLLLNEIMREAINDSDLPVLKEMIVRAEKNAERMNKMIGGLYNVTKVHSGQFSLEKSKFNFIDMVKEAIETVQVLQPAYKIKIEGDGDFDIEADRYRIIQVITNYLSNAIKYSNGNKEVILGISRLKNMVTAYVKDNGLGISKEHLPYLFERFFRIEKTKSIEGIGLGLYLCRQIIRAHHGHVWAESELNKGSTFFFSLPLNANDLES